MFETICLDRHNSDVGRLEGLEFQEPNFSCQEFLEFPEVLIWTNSVLQKGAKFTNPEV